MLNSNKLLIEIARLTAVEKAAKELYMSDARQCDAGCDVNDLWNELVEVAEWENTCSKDTCNSDASENCKGNTCIPIESVSDGVILSEDDILDAELTVELDNDDQPTKESN